MNFLKKNLFKLVLIAFLVIVPVFVVYSDGETCLPGTICNPLASKGIDNIPEFIKILLEGVLKVGIPIVALAIIYSGFLFVKAQGNSEALKKAKEALFYTLIGAAILLGSWAIAKLISDTVLAL